MTKKVLGLGADGKLVLKLPGGVSQPLPEPVHSRAFLLIDCSSSMAGSKLVQARGGALAFAVDAMRKGFSVGLIAFANTAETLCRIEDGFPMLTSRLEQLEASGTTNMAHGISRAVHELSVPASGTRAIVVVTDGMPDNAELTLGEARRAKKLSIDIIAIGTDDADHNFLQELASRSDLAVTVPRAQLKSGITNAAKLLPRGSAR